ncbi:MAG: hypothetical protein ACM3UT_12990, partial [Chloroflexota bacterium]
MKITRENYELWFVDWLDSRLSGEDIEELNFFLDNNPDLREEFTDLSAIRLKPDVMSFQAKDKVQRNLAAIPLKQFEILCAASAENDLDEQQYNELNEIISSDPEKARTLRIFSKLKLLPPEIYYVRKKNLFRMTVVQRVMRVASIGLSAAAVVAILLMTGVFRQHDRSEIKPVAAINNQVQLPPAGTIQEAPLENTPAIAEEARPGKRSGYSGPNGVGRGLSGANGLVAEDNKIDRISEREPVVAPGKIAFTGQPQLAGKTDDNMIMPFTATFIPPEKTDPDDGRSNVGRFMARHFRSNVL